MGFALADLLLEYGADTNAGTGVWQIYLFILTLNYIVLYLITAFPLWSFTTGAQCERLVLDMVASNRLKKR